MRTRKKLSVLSGIGGSLIAMSAAHAGITGVSISRTDFSNGYVLADGTIAAGTTTTVGDAWAIFRQEWSVCRLWATVDSALSTVGGVGGSVANNTDLVLWPGSGGVFYNHPVLDSDASQNPAIFTVPEFANAAFDTWVTIGAADGSVTPLITEPNDEFNGFQSSISCQNCGWTTTPMAGNGVVSDGQGGFRVLLGQFTVRGDSYFSGQMFVAGGGQIVLDDFTHFPAFPAPSAIAVLVLAGLPRRRRRCGGG